MDEEKEKSINESSGQSQRTHSLVRAILKREASEEISKLLIESNKEDLNRERLLVADMTVKHSIKKITNDIINVTNFLGSNPDKLSSDKNQYISLMKGKLEFCHM